MRASVARVRQRAARRETSALMEDEAIAGITQVTLPDVVTRRRAEGAQRAAFVGLAGFMAIFALVKAKATQAVDVAITMRWQSIKNPLLSRVMEFVSWPGFPPQSKIIPPLLMLAMLALRLRLEALFQLLAWFTGAISEWLKTLMKRPRPLAGTDLRVVAAPLGGSSFPSGHTITYAGTYGWLAYVIWTNLRPRWPRRILVGALAALIAAVGPSRIYQGHHWPTDVAASYLLGMSYLIGLTSLYRWVKGRGVRPQPSPKR
jgi:undecaprenyl-diphosphatase